MAIVTDIDQHMAKRWKWKSQALQQIRLTSVALFCKVNQFGYHQS